MNSEFYVTEVNGPKTSREFLLLPVALYKHEKNWIRPLDKDIESVFDPKQNKLFRNGECIRWILKDATHKTVGRVAAFVDYKAAKNNAQPTGGMGFFECINNREAAFILFNQCKNWLKERGMEAMDGPVNFGDRDRWWGLLAEGFSEPNYCMPYNFTYYKDLFEAYGFQNYFNQYTYYRLINQEGLDEKINQKAERIAQNPHYSFRHITKKKLDDVAEEFRTVYNKGWARFPGVKAISKLHAQTLLNSMKPIMDEKLIWFGYYNDRPIAFFIMMPEMNQIFKHLNGKLNLWGKIKFLYHKWTGTCKKAFGVIFGIVPEHQGKGIEGALVMAFAKVAWEPGFPYKELELNWIGDFNPSMMRVAEQIGGKIVKTHITYRYLFDRTKKFERARVVNVKSGE